VSVENTKLARRALKPDVSLSAAKKRAEAEKKGPENSCRSHTKIYVIRERAADGQSNSLCSLNSPLPTAGIVAPILSNQADAAGSSRINLLCLKLYKSE